MKGWGEERWRFEGGGGKREVAGYGEKGVAVSSCEFQGGVHYSMLVVHDRAKLVDAAVFRGHVNVATAKRISHVV